MAAPAVPGDAADLYAAVQAVGMELCPALGITIPVGKDSMSMSTVWQEGGSGEKKPKRITAPISLIVSAFAPVADIRLSLTPQLRYDPESTTKDTKSTKSEAIKQKQNSSSDSFVSSVNFVAYTQGSEPVGDTVLLLIDLGRGKNRLGGSILAQVVSQMGEAPPDVDSATDLKNFWNAIQQLGREKKLLAYHDRSDGGLLATAIEMAFAGHTGVDLELSAGTASKSQVTSTKVQGPAAEAEVPCSKSQVPRNTEAEASEPKTQNSKLKTIPFPCHGTPIQRSMPPLAGSKQEIWNARTRRPPSST
jgi:phosphoribosylformylglycinamidine synthase